MQYITPKVNIKGYALLVAAILLWSTAEVGIRHIRNDISPFQFAWIRFSLGGLLLWPLLPWDLRRKGLKLDRRILWNSVWLSLFGVVFTGITFQYSLKLTGAAVVATMYGATPIMVLVLSRFILGDPITGARLLGVFLGFAGIAVLALSKESETFTLLGFGLCVINALSFSLFSVLIKKLGGQFAGLPITALTVLFGSLFLLVPVLIERDTTLLHTWPRIWPTLLYLSFCTTGLAYLCFFSGLELVDATSAASVILLKPPIATLLAAVLLGEQITWNILVSIAGIIGGLYLVNAAHGRRFRRKMGLDSANAQAAPPQ